MPAASDTIAAIASAIGPAARMIVRLAGPAAVNVTRAIAPRWSAAPASAVESVLTFAGLDCPAFIYCFRSPHSYTGDDLIELHVPGNPILVRLLLNRLLEYGCRPAEPGEFTSRAYFAGKMDLTAAEGVAAAVSAANAAQLKAARQLMAGELSRRVSPVVESIADTLALVEAEIDFSDQDVTFLSADEVARRVTRATADIGTLSSDAGRLESLSHTRVVVLAGRPNAGKSSLINALSGTARAVVSDVPGTTRDRLSADVSVPNGTITMQDMAGLDEADDDIARQMQSAARHAIDAADHVILVVDSTDGRTLLGIEHDLLVLTKSDLQSKPRVYTRGSVGVSVVTGGGLDDLRRELGRLAFDPESTPTVSLNARHRSALADAVAALSRVPGQPAELAAADLREALDALGSISGVVSPDDVLGKVFSTFCIGK